MIKKLILTLTITTVYVFAHTNIHDKMVEKMSIYKVNKYVYVIYGGNSGNSIVLKDSKNKMLLIDTKHGNVSKELVKQIAKIGDIKNLKYMINTHSHADHTGGNANLNYEIIAQDNVRATLIKEKKPKKMLPDITYNKELHIYLQNFDLDLVHLKHGHTNSDTVTYIKKFNIVNPADLYFTNRFPYIDLSSGGNAISYMKNVKTVLNKINSKTVVIPGHGDVSSKKEYKAFYSMLHKTITKITKLKKAGKSESDIYKIMSKNKSLDKYNWAFVDLKKYINTVYRSIK